jgi:hypothetical protein
MCGGMYASSLLTLLPVVAIAGAGMDRVGLQQCSILGKALLFGIVAALMINGGWLLARSNLPPVIRAAGAVQVRAHWAADSYVNASPSACPP